MKTIKLELKAVDFKGAQFMDGCNCAIAKAAKRQIGSTNVREYGCGIDLDGDIYSHSEYYGETYNCDKPQATSHNFDNTTIRTITLTKML